MGHGTRFRLLKRILLGFSVVVLILFISAYLLLLHILETRTLWAPKDRRPTPEPAARIQAAEGINIACTWLPPRKKGSKVFLYSYGTGCQLNGSMSFAREFTRRGYGFLGYDYEGFGSSDGRPTLTATIRDVEAAYNYLTTECGIEPEQIIAIGYSMGTGPSAYLAATHPIGGCVLLAGFASIFQVKSRYGFWPGNKLQVSSWLKEAQCPVLLIHGTEDQVVPYRNAEINYNAIKGKKELITLPGVNHWLGDILEGVGAKRFFEIIEATF